MFMKISFNLCVTNIISIFSLLYWHIKRCCGVHMIQKYNYFAFAHSILSYSITFWGISKHSNMIFKIQKRMIRIIMNVDSRTSCRSFFKQLGILPLQSQYIYSLMSFVSTNRELFVNNADIHNFPTRSYKDLHLPIAHLSIFQKECISLVLKSIIIFLRGLNKYLMTTSSLKKR